VRIAIVTQYYAPEAIRIPDTLARALAAKGHQVRVITGHPNYPDGEIFPGYKQRWNSVERIDGVQVRRVPLFISHSYNPIARFTNYLSFAGSAALFRGWVKNADVVYVYATQMTPAIGPSIWNAIFRTPYVLHIQDLWPESVTGSSMVGGGAPKRLIGAVLNPWLRYLYRTAAATIAIAPTMSRMLIERGVPAERMHTVFNWSATENHAAAHVEPEERDFVSIVYAGNLGDHQGLDAVVTAANAVKHIENLRVTIVGSGVAEKRLRALASDLDAHNVEFLGRVSPEEMGKVHGMSDFQIVSLRDIEIFNGTIPSKLQASLEQGIPVITAVRGDVKSLVVDNGLGFACDPEDPEQLAAAFAKAAALSNEDRLTMGSTAKQFYNHTMSMASGVSSIEKILGSVARHSSRDTWRQK